MVPQKSHPFGSFEGSRIGCERLDSKKVILQRLFSTFANGWPGKGLLTLRLALASFLFHDAALQFRDTTDVAPVILQIACAGAGVFLFLGLWTPIIAGVAALLQIWIACSRTGNVWAALLAAAIGAGLSLIGPGAWSLDALLYGRKRITLRD